jgi:predicted O-methyltransferase YrrM
MTTSTTTPTATAEQVEELAGRIFGAGLGAVELFTVHLGKELGLYEALEEGGPQTTAELAKRTGLAERYVREWLQSQAASGFVTLDGGDVHTGRSALAPGVHETLIDNVHPAYVGALPGLLPIVGRMMPELAEAFRTGKGVSYEAYGPDAVALQEGMNRPMFENSLVSEWLPQIPDVLERLRDTVRPAKVGEVACGAGWATIVLAEAFPHLTIESCDIDEESIARARRNAAERGVSDRTVFEVADLSAADHSLLEPVYDALFMFEALHDLARPVEALTTCRLALKPGAPLIVMDENVAEHPTAPADEVERFMAAGSTLWCTPMGHGPGSEVVGAVMRPAKLEDLAKRAGFQGTEILPIEHPFFRFYRLTA